MMAELPEPTAMTLARFEALCEAFGGDLERWPLALRQAARAASRSASAQRLLAKARALDQALARSPAPAPSPALRDRVVGAGPRARRAAPAWGWLIGVGLGAGLAGAAAAGLAAGLIIAPMALAPASPVAGGDPIAQASMLLGEPSELTDG
jgi:hypothetical protein